MVAWLLLAAGCPAGPAGPAADGKADSDAASVDTAPEPSTEDHDGDGYSPATGDCDDELPHVYPGAPDYCDGLDQDCDGEPIPDGSCSQRGNGRAMWSWLVESNEALEGWLDGPAGDQDGDGLDELQLRVYERPSSEESHLHVASLFGSDWAGRPAIGGVPSRGFTSEGSRYTNPYQSDGGDFDGDGMNEMVVRTADDWECCEGAVLLYYGRAGGWPEGGGSVEDEADAIWTGEGVEQIGTQPAGDFNGDGLADVLINTIPDDLGEGVTAVVFGSPVRASGAQPITSLPMVFYRSSSGTLEAARLEVVPDLDGDGTDELSFPYRASDSVYFQAFVSGAELSDQAQLADSMSLVSYSDGNIPNPLTYHTHDAGDWNGDGYNDLAAAPYPEDGELVCASLLSGGMPEGVVEDQAFAQICELELPDSVTGWVPDLDGDGEPELMPDPSCIVASRRAPIGGTVLLSDVAGPCLSGGHDDSALIRAVANVTGDDRAEFAVAVPDSTLTASSIAIIAGFDIPYDDPSKW